LGLALSKGPNRVGVSLPPPHLKTETDPVSETLCFLVFTIPDDAQILKILILYLIMEAVRYFEVSVNITRQHGVTPQKAVPFMVIA
jgi:hypothetical protein